MTMWDDLGEFIAKKSNSNFKKWNKTQNSSCKIVEIAIGKFFAVADYLTNSNLGDIEFIATDINPANSTVTFDDVTNPNMNIYENADIIYSIRPPQELQPYIANIVTENGAILIIKPLFNEDLNLNLNMKLVNYKKAVFYQSK